MILAPERHGPDGAFDGVVVELDAAVVEEAAQRRPARERVADGPGQPAATVVSEAAVCGTAVIASTNGGVGDLYESIRLGARWERLVG